MYSKVKSLESTALTYRKRMNTFKQRLNLAKKAFHTFENGLREESFQVSFLKLMSRSLKSTGTRYTLKEKLICLTLYKTCGSAYRFLAKWFNLPTKRTITRLLHNIPVKAGINDVVFENLEKKVKKMTSKEKLCSVIFDEIAILPHVEYDRFNDKIVGIQNQEIVDHALVFMVKGIYNKWKQVIAYTFCKGTTKSPVIKTLLQTVIEKLNASGM